MEQEGIEVFSEGADLGVLLPHAQTLCRGWEALGAA